MPEFEDPTKEKAWQLVRADMLATNDGAVDPRVIEAIASAAVRHFDTILNSMQIHGAPEPVEGERGSVWLDRVTNTLVSRLEGILQGGQRHL